MTLASRGAGLAGWSGQSRGLGEDAPGGLLQCPERAYDMPNHSPNKEGEKMRTGNLCLCLIVLSSVCLAATASAAPASTRRFTDQLLSTYERDDSHASMAYNDTAKEYLVTWNMGGDIFGQRLDLYGVPVSDVFPIHYADFYAYRTAVAYSHENNAYLVVWEQLGHGYDIHGQLVSADGRLLDNPTTPEDESQPERGFAIAGRGSGQDNEADPHLACDGQSFLVVWMHAASDARWGIQATRVSGDGSVHSKPLELSPNDGVLRGRPRVAFHDETNEYLVAYERGASADAGGQIAGRRVLAGGTLPGEEFTLAAMGGSRAPDVVSQGADGFLVVYAGDGHGLPDGVYSRIVGAGQDSRLGVQREVAAGGGSYSQPRVSFAGAAESGLLVWEDDRTRATSGTDIRAQRVTREGQPVGPMVALSAGAGDDLAPAIAASSSPEAYLVAWSRMQGEQCDLYAQRVSTLGSLMGSEFGLAARHGPQHQPAIAYNLDDDEFLAVWADDTDKAIYGRRLDASGLPLETPWPIDEAGYNSNPAVLYHDARGHYLVAWTDTERGAVEVAVIGRGGKAIAKSVAGSGVGHFPRMAWETPEDRVLLVWQAAGDIAAAVVNGDGTPTRSGLCRVAEGAADQAHPDVVYDAMGQRFLVVWEERTGSGHDVYGRFVSRSCQPQSEAQCLAGCTDDADHFAATLSPDPNRKEFLLLRAMSADPRSVTLLGRRLDADGRPLGVDIPVAAEPTERQAQIRLQARAAYAPAARSHLVVWPQWGVDGARMDLYVRWLGMPPGTTTPPRLFLHYPGDQYDPAVALGGGGDRLLVAWTDGRRAGGLDVYGRYLALDVTPPRARLAVEPIVGVVGTTFSLSAEASTDDTTPASALEARWDFDSNGDWDTAWSLVKTVTRTLTVAGIYTVTVQVADHSALTGVARRAFRVVPAIANQPPVARLSVSPARGPAGTVFQLDASGSSDPETPSSELAVRWDYGADGDLDTDWSVAKTTQWTLTDAGTQAVRLVVRDGAGLTGSTLAQVVVDPAGLAQLAIVPAFALVRPREVVRFALRGSDGFGNPIDRPEARWTLTDPAVGQIDAQGVFTAGLRSGLFRDVVRATGGAASAGASLRFVWSACLFMPWSARAAH